MWGGLGQAATVAQLVGADVGGLISMIMQAALTARQNKKECEQLARRVFMIAELLPHLQDPEVMRRPEVRRPLVGLDETLREAHELVMSCQEKSAAYRLVMAWRQAERFREVQSSIDSYLLVFPFISHIDITCRLDRIYNILLPNDSTAPPAGSRIQEFAAVAQQVVVHGDSCEEFTLAVLAAATNNFASATMIGQGGFGGVYKGTLPDGRKVAIKRKTMESLQGDSQFHAEITSLSSIHHNHVVRLYGYCAVGEERMLVYEYAENGSLDDHLHGRRSSSSSSSPVTASWKMRFEVLLGLSRAVEHLESYPERRVIHRDIKSSNVLLDASWAPILTDFGISLTVDETDCENGVDVPVRGTYGYAAPEYIATGILKPTSDVYSLGVVMLEVLTGKRAMFRRDDTGNADALGGQESLVCFALPIIEAGTVWKVLDKRPTRSPTRRQLKAANLVARMAARCLRHQEYTRPPLPEVVSVLEKAVELARGDDDRAVRRYFSELR